MRVNVSLLGVFLLIALAAPAGAHADVKPIVSKMLENLAGVNLIARGFALEDLGQVVSGAEQLVHRSEELRRLSSKDLAISHERRPKFDSYIDLLVTHANSLREAALKRRTRDAVDAFRKVVEEGCTSCHKEFREQGGQVKLGVYLMTSVMNGLEELDRGALLNDYWLIATSAREIQDVARLMQWDQVIDFTFNVETADWAAFKKYARALDRAARAVEVAAEDRDEKRVFKEIRRLMLDSCLGCHEQFRKAE